MSVYLSAGLYAEGPTDDRFLLPLLERMIFEVGMRVIPEGLEPIPRPTRIEPPRDSPKARDHRIAAAIDSYWSQCTLFILHSDGAGDPEEARRRCIEPGITRARQMHPDVAVAACIPVREIEAWMLADGEPFRKLLGGQHEPELSTDPERLLSPKNEIEAILQTLGANKLRRHHCYAQFGENVRLHRLRKLTAFRTFEAELEQAIRAVARPGRAQARK